MADESLGQWDSDFMVRADHLQSFKGYLRQTLVFVWNSAMREKFNFYSSVVFGWFCRWGWALVHHFSKCWDFPDFPFFPRILGLDPKIGHSWGNSYTPCLLLIMALRFTCGERKSWWNIKKSDNIISMIVGKILFAFYVFVNTSIC